MRYLIFHPVVSRHRTPIKGFQQHRAGLEIAMAETRLRADAGGGSQNSVGGASHVTLTQ